MRTELSTLIILKINEMRTQLELWQVVKENFDEYFLGGLCILLSRLYIKEIISRDESISIYNEIKSYGYTRDFFLGDEGDPKPRLEFIEKMIKKHSENAITENK